METEENAGLPYMGFKALSPAAVVQAPKWTTSSHKQKNRTTSLPTLWLLYSLERN